MDELSRDEMTKEQMIIVEEHEKQVSERQKAMGDNDRSLGIELIRLRSEVSDVTNSFNEKVEAQQEEKEKAQDCIERHELYLLRLASAIFLGENNVKENGRIDEEIKRLEETEKSTKVVSSKLLSEFRRLEDIHTEKKDEGKMMEKNFRMSIQHISEEPVDQETVKLLLQLYKKRYKTCDRPKKHNMPRRVTSNQHSPSKTSLDTLSRRSSYSRQSGREGSSWQASNRRGTVESSRNSRSSATGVLSSMNLAVKEIREFPDAQFFSEEDPFASLDGIADVDNERDDSKVMLVPEEVIPEGFKIHDDIWHKMQELRLEKIQHEAATEIVSKAVQEIRNRVDQAKNNEDRVSIAIDCLKKERKDLERVKQRLCNSDILIQLNEGLDEMKREKSVPTDYNHGVVIPLSTIEQTNASIQGLGDERLKILHKIKDLRKRINSMKWDHELLGLVEKNFKELYTDLQLLRVSNQLKMVIAGDKGETEEIKITRAEDRLAKKTSVHGNKIVERQKRNYQIQSMIRKKQGENQKLQAQLEELERTVQKKESVSKQVSGEDEECQGASSEQKMKRILKRRKLVDLCKDQESEIAALSVEVDRLRQRTFPSFSRSIPPNGH